MTVDTKPSTTNKHTAIARFEDVRQAMAEYTPDRYIALIPTVDMERSPLYRPAAMVVPVDPEDKRDVYQSPAQDGTVCLRARKLEQIGSAIGVKWLDVKMSYPDDKRVTATVYAEFTDGVGDRIPLVAAATEFLTPAKGRTVSTFPDEKAQARARAILVKKLTGLPTSFPPAELKAKSFAGLRWVLDDTQPDIREAIITRGTRAAADVFGHEAPQKAIDAGHAGPEDGVIETTGRTHEAEAEPEIPDAGAPPAAAAPADTDVNALITPIRRAAAHQPDKNPASDDLLLTLGTAIRDVLGVKGKAASAARLSIAQLVYGPEVTVIRGLTGGQAHALLDLTKEPEGQAVIRALLAHQLAHDESIAWVKDELAQKAAA